MRELNVNEIEQVKGGVAPIVWGIAIAVLIMVKGCKDHHDKKMANGTHE